MGNQISQKNTKEEELLSKWSSKEQEQLNQTKDLPSCFVKELFASFTEHATRTEYLETAYKLVKLKDTDSIYPFFQTCVHKYNISLKVFVSWIVISAIPLWFDQKVNTKNYDSSRLVDFLLNHAKEQESQTSQSMDWLLEPGEKKENDHDDWELKSICSPSQIDSNEFINWLNNTPSFFRLFCLAAEYAFFGSNNAKGLHKRRLDHMVSPQLNSITFSELLSPFDYFLLSQYLPSTSLSSDTKDLSHQLIFSSKRDGVSWQVFVNTIVGSGSVLIVIKSKDGSIFGGYVDETLYQKTDWYGNTSNFLFQLEPKCGVWLSTSTNDHYQYLCWGKKSLPNGFGMGGQFDYSGLWIDSDFLHGHSRAGPACSTFKSPQLTQEDTFLVDEVE
ncbi:hypothetical protein CU098_001075, partial [Rhizopus stolonifer]